MLERLSIEKKKCPVMIEPVGTGTVKHTFSQGVVKASDALQASHSFSSRSPETALLTRISTIKTPFHFP